ncbi:class I SAM-dependent methyltransferase [Metabacillus sp. GX 13764]|uniref:SAM-dependent methyltransferase n=1 Tax=Metabacillus kandeliae TaxID=2900151 RepID=UPI001E44BCD5|nr:class I SAM-dependent methyltransferase [Metabacillus kandeliae]MCD7034246.1 class I SAM-dependent methyltransferase [Metabacillus kandeliae]
MDRNKFSAIAHKDHLFYNPISQDKWKRVIELLSLKKDDRILDIGAGRGEMLLKILERYGSRCLAVEQYKGFTDLMKARSENFGLSDRLTILNEDAAKTVKELNQEFQAAICIGSSHALGNYQKTIEILKGIVVEGGFILMGEIYWRKKPDAEYLDFFGGEEGDVLSHAGNIFAAEEHGLTPLWSATASEDDWDCYEWLYSKSIEDYCYHNPDDPDCAEMLERIRSWREMYLKYGRETLGFGLYLFRKN